MPALWVTSSNHERPASPESGACAPAEIAINAITMAAEALELDRDRGIGSVGNCGIGLRHQPIIALRDFDDLIGGYMRKGLQAARGRPANNQLVHDPTLIEAKVLAH